jgi:precorrin-4 methylase
MVLYLIGLGLYDEQDITLRGLNAIKQCQRVYLEAYTSILMCDKSKLEQLYEREVVVADREMVENEAETILEGADQYDVAFLVVGDPFGATTHTGQHRTNLHIKFKLDPCNSATAEAHLSYIVPENSRIHFVFALSSSLTQHHQVRQRCYISLLWQYNELDVFIHSSNHRS